MGRSCSGAAHLLVGNINILCDTVITPSIWVSSAPAWPCSVCRPRTAGAGLPCNPSHSPAPTRCRLGLGPLIWPFVSIFDPVFRYRSAALHSQADGHTAYLVVCGGVAPYIANIQTSLVLACLWLVIACGDCNRDYHRHQPPPRHGHLQHHQDHGQGE